MYRVLASPTHNPSPQTTRRPSLHPPGSHRGVAGAYYLLPAVRRPPADSTLGLEELESSYEDELSEDEDSPSLDVPSRDLSLALWAAEAPIKDSEELLSATCSLVT